MPDPTLAVVTATAIEDAAKGLLAHGTISFTPVDAQLRPASFGIQGGGTLLAEPVTRSIANGAMTGPLQLVRSDMTIQVGANYLIRVTDARNGWSTVLGIASIAAPAWDLGAWAPSTVQTAPPAAWVSTGSNANAAAVPWSATPVFDFGAGLVLQLTLAGAVTSSTAVNSKPGQAYLLEVIQPPGAGYPFAWPAQLRNAPPVSPQPGSVSSLLVYGVPGGLRALGPITYS